MIKNNFEKWKHLDKKDNLWDSKKKMMKTNKMMSNFKPQKNT